MNTLMHYDDELPPSFVGSCFCLIYVHFRFSLISFKDVIRFIVEEFRNLAYFTSTKRCDSSQDNGSTMWCHALNFSLFLVL